MSGGSRSSLLLIGCGHMGGAMLRGWRRDQLDIEVSVVDPQYHSSETGDERIFADLEMLPDDYCADTVMIAVPPQIAERAIAHLRPRLKPDTMVISIMAGKPVAWLSDALLGHTPLIRVMPNLPAAIGMGISGYYVEGQLSHRQQQLLQQLLGALGDSVAVNSEAQINVVTAVSGSGPAYAFLLIKAMTEAGIALGLESETAEKLASHTVAGAGQYALQSSESAETLLSHIAVAGGTTEAALYQLAKDNQFSTLMHAAITAATDRANELA